MNVRHISHIVYLSAITIALLIAGSLTMHLGFWQLKKIQQEQKAFQAFSELTAPQSQISDFAFIRTSAKLIPHSEGSFYQVKPPYQVGYAHFALFQTPTFDRLLVLYDWSQTPRAQKSIPVNIEGTALPFNLIAKQKIITPKDITWPQVFSGPTPSHFIIGSHFPNTAYFQLMFTPKLATHYNYAFQFFLMGITLIILAGYFFCRKTHD